LQNNVLKGYKFMASCCTPADASTSTTVDSSQLTANVWLQPISIDGSGSVGPENIGSIRYGKVINNNGFYTMVAPKPIEINKLMDYQNKSASVGNPIAVKDLDFISLVSLSPTCNYIPTCVPEVKELIDEFGSVYLSGANFIPNMHGEISEMLVSPDTLEFYAKLPDGRIVNYEMDLYKFITTYRVCADTPRIIDIKDVVASESIWNRVLSLMETKRRMVTGRPYVIVNPYPISYSLLTICEDKCIHTRYVRCKHPIFDDAIERIVLTNDDIMRFVYQTDSCICGNKCLC